MRETCLVHITKTHTQREKKKIRERERGLPTSDTEMVGRREFI
jgi:hypothetical protein